MRLRPFIAGAALYVAIVAAVLVAVGKRTGFQQIYCLDDTYIHLAIAKNLVLTSTFGVIPHHFAAVASSVIWPFLLAAFSAIAGIHSVIPFVANLVISLLVLYAAQKLFRALQPSAPEWMQVTLQIALVLATSLVMLTFAGMEHVLQILVDLLFLFFLVERDKPRAALLCCCALLVGATRYEGLFLVFVGCLLLLWRREIWVAFAAGIAGLGPALAMGAYSVAHGSHWLPNTLMVKATNPGQLRLRPAVFSPPEQALLCVYSLRQGLGELFLIACGLFAFGLFFRGLLSRRTQWMLAVYVGTAILHAQFSRLNWVYRYEGYLIALGLFVVFNAAADVWTRRAELSAKYMRPGAFAVSMLAVCLVFFIPRARTNIREVAPRAAAIYDQQFQMARFLSTYYETTNIAANDIGAITFYGDHSDLLDLAGLASLDVTDSLAHKDFNTQRIRELAEKHGTRIAIAYPSWFKDSLAFPADWVQVGTWTIPRENRYYVGGTTVAFYAVHAQDAPALAANLRAFSPHLPAQVSEAGMYKKVSNLLASAR